MPRETRRKLERDEYGRLLPGQASLNPNGRPKGSESFKTKMFRAMEKIAEDRGETLDDVERELLTVGYEKAKKGDYQFYRDMFDRIYGKPQQSIDHTTGGEKINGEMPKLEDKEATDKYHEMLKENMKKRIIEKDGV